MASINGTCISFPLIEEGGLSTAVLFRGPSGAGKSDLALRLIDDGAMLVADDWVEIENSGGALKVSAPKAIEGMLEVRGVGLIRLPIVTEARLVALIDLSLPEEIDRLPETTCSEVLGIELPLWCLNAFEASAMSKVGIIVALAAGRADLVT